MAAGEGEMTIGEVADRSGVRPSTLRYWESVGVLRPPRRVGGRRRYGAENLREVEMVALAKRVGLTLAETRVILAGFSAGRPPPEVWRRLAGRKLPELEQTLIRVTALKSILEAGLRCECLDLEQCLRHAA